jgi:hypothetical protein
MRTEGVQCAFVKAMISAKQRNDSKAASDLSSRTSTHALPSSFWGLGAVDIHEKITHEKLHNNSLGVTKLVLRVIEVYVKSVFQKRARGKLDAKQITSELNRRLNNLDK